MTVVRVLIRQLGEPGGVYVLLDDPDPCDGCDTWCYCVWRLHRYGLKLCTDCFINGPDE